MRIGFCTQYKEERIRFAKEAGFEGVEVSISADSPLDPRIVKDDEVKRAKEVLDENGIKLLSLFHFFEYGAKDEQKRKEAIETFPRALEMAKILGTNILTVNSFTLEEGDLQSRIKYFKEVFTSFAKQAEDKGMKIGIENCPHELNNLAYSPKMWEVVFQEVPSKALGLEYDPSHLVWQQIDYLKAIYDFGDRIYAFHAKDTEVMKDKLGKSGVLQGLFEGSVWKSDWWRYRLPGYGEVDWKRVFVALADIGYNGDINIEHEDPVFGGDKTDEGLKRGLKYLKQFIL